MSAHSFYASMWMLTVECYLPVARYSSSLETAAQWKWIWVLSIHSWFVWNVIAFRPSFELISCACKFVNNSRFSYFNRCRIWIEKTNRYDLLEKANVHEERICQMHFEPSAFINESRNRLHQSAYPMLHLTSECDSTNDDMTFNGIPLSLFNVSLNANICSYQCCKNF